MATGGAGRSAVTRDGWTADEAIEQLYAAHWTRLVRLSVLLVRDTGTAEEVVQDAFVAVHARWHKLREPDKALAYLRQAVVNRHAARETDPHPHPGADETALDADRRHAVLDARRALPRRQREVLALRYYLDLTETEIADTLGISRGSVKAHASRGSAALRELLDGADL